MPTLLCTAKYRKAFGLPERLSAAEVDEGALGPWYADTLNAGSLRFVHYMSAPSLLSVIVRLRERASAEQRFVRALHDLLVDLSVPEAWIDRETESLLSFHYARARNLSDLGYLRDHAWVARSRFLRDDFSEAEVNLDLSENPPTAGHRGFPRNVARERLAARWRWEE
ncbi:MAG TPA: hypothetical protein VGJ82_12085 [Thermoanaerobaculia bacterium]|jgi:hypothetical protein